MTVSDEAVKAALEVVRQACLNHSTTMLRIAAQALAKPNPQVIEVVRKAIEAALQKMNGAS